MGRVSESGLHHAAYFFARVVTLLVYVISLANNAAALGIKLDKFIKRICREIAVFQGLANRIQIFSYKIEV